jgi:hypothetical protein
VVPRDSLRLQAEEAFADPGWRAALGHALSVRAARTRPIPCRVSRATSPPTRGSPPRPTCTSRVPPAPLPAGRGRGAPPAGPGANDNGAASADDAAGWSAAIEPLLALAAVRLLLSGTLERADGRRILGLPYRRAAGGREEVDLAAPSLAVVGYSRARALAERAVLPVSFGALDGEASWLGPEGETGERPHLGPHRLRAPAPNEATRPALFTALRTGFADALLRRAFEATRRLRAERRGRLGVAARRGGARPGQAAGGRARPGAGAALPRHAAPVGAAAPGGHARPCRVGGARCAWHARCLPADARAIGAGDGRDGL